MLTEEREHNPPWLKGLSSCWECALSSPVTVTISISIAAVIIVGKHVKTGGVENF
ncbi:hypothetical protein BT93_D0824 [Corymbia citriodora subsp. variegata]|nr:hypothetical protein BT93_D0824 [Corymbia citriodora subsp. variegata]